MATTSTTTSTCRSPRRRWRTARWTTTTRCRNSRATKRPAPACSIATGPAPSSTPTLPTRAGSTSWSARTTISTSCRRGATKRACLTPWRGSATTIATPPAREGSCARSRDAPALAQEDDRSRKRDDEHGEHAELDEEMPVHFLGPLAHLAELRGQHQDAADDGDQPDEQERLGHDGVLAKRDLHRVEQLDDQEDQQDAVEQADHRGGKRCRGDVLDQVDGAAHQQRHRHPEPDVDDVLDEGEAACDPAARVARRELLEFLVAHGRFSSA